MTSIIKNIAIIALAIVTLPLCFVVELASAVNKQTEASQGKKLAMIALFLLLLPVAVVVWSMSYVAKVASQK